jgi:tRNA(Ile)-lysidine synthase
MRGMKTISEMNGLTLYRPLLEMTKTDIMNYCLDHDIPFVNDPSNDSNDYDRNALRNQILPFIEMRFSHFKKALLKTMGNILDADECLTDLAKMDLESVFEAESINIKKIRELGLSPARIRNMLIYFMNSKGLALNQTELVFFSEKLLTISYDGNLELVGRNGVIRKLKQRGKYLRLE